MRFDGARFLDASKFNLEEFVCIRTLKYAVFCIGNFDIKKGELLGRIGGQTLDLSINYDKFILPGFLEPSSYKSEEWKIHTVDPFDYWEPKVNEELMKKNIRKVKPYGGKIDYDQDGKLVR
jgi:hypothetical protein